MYCSQGVVIILIISDNNSHYFLDFKMDFYNDEDTWVFPKERYPTWDDCMRYYKSRINTKVTQKSVINQLSEAVETIWKSGDGCPKSKNRIMVQLESYVIPQYQKYRKGDMQPNKSKKKKSQTPAQSPVRKSARSSHPADVENTPEATEGPGHGVEAGGHDAHCSSAK